MDERFEFGNRLYELRTEKNLTQKELGKLLGVSNKAVSKWETGEAKPRVNTLNKLSEILGVSLSELMGSEPVAEDEQTDRIKGYSNFFLSQSKKLDSRFKLTKFLIVAVFVALFALSFAEELHEALGGAPLESAYFTIEYLVIAIYLALCFYFVTGICKSEEQPKNIKVSKMIGWFAVTTPVLSIAYILDYYYEYRSELLEVISYSEIAVMLIASLILILFSILYKKNSKIIQKYNSAAVITLIIVVFFLAGLAVANPILLIVSLLLFTVRSACKKIEWTVLAQKVNSEFSEQRESDNKRKYILIACITAGVIIIGAVSSLLTPYIMYKRLYAQLPDYLKQPIPEYEHYDLRFESEETQRVDFEDISFLCPADWNVEHYVEETVSEDEEPYQCIRYLDSEKGYAVLVNEEENVDVLRGISPDDEEFEYLDDETKQEIVEFEITKNKADKLFKKYFNVPYYMNMYQAKYLQYRADLRNAKWYQTEKLAAYIIVLFIKSVPDSIKDVRYFETDTKCGFISRAEGSNYRYFNEVNIFRDDGLSDDNYYQILFRFNSLSEEESIALMSKIINSVEFH